MRLRITGLLLCCAVYHGDLFACDDWAAKVVAVNGLVVVEPHTASSSTLASSVSGRKSIKIDSVVCHGQRLLTGKNSRVALYLSNNSYMRLDQNSILVLPQQNRPDSFWIRLQQGVSHLISRINRRFEIETPFVNAAVEGTEFLIAASSSDASISVIEGRVSASKSSPASIEPVIAGQKLIADATPSPYRIIQIEKSTSVDWAIYYPPLFTLGQLEAGGQQRWLEAAAQQLRQARPDLALQELDGADQGNPAVRVAKAALLLSVGQVESARDTLRGLQSATALALQSIVFSSLNQGAAALTAAQQAVAAEPQSVPALVALSYARQAQLQLPEALEAALSASKTAPQSALAWSRVSELQLALGQTGAARTSAQRAFDLDPTDSQTLTQLAFLNLFNLDLDSAQDQFQQAIESDSEDPQAHLGLGLALLRQGELHQGRRQIEIATSVDPARSVLRSYLGRAYFEEKRDAEAEVQWQLAKEFDPQDPTPWFYEGVRKLFANNPVGAIEQLEVSRDLNAKRALYRSETLLQSDAASRSATLARAYREAGYHRGVFSAAWQALASDPTSPEGHRMLADTYLGDSRFEVARASELLQSQLWQPLSAFPLQPQLSETEIAYLEGSGPQRPGFNEYHSLFTQNGLYASANGYGAGDGIWGNDLIGTYLAGPLAVSISQYHYEADGWRENSSQQQDLYGGLVQWQPTSATAVQLEARKLRWQRENIAPLVSANLGPGITGTDFEQDTYRFGASHIINPANKIAFSFIKQDRYIPNSQLDQIISPFFSSETRIESSDDTATQTAELQGVYNTDIFSLVYGGGYSKSDSESSVDFDLTIDQGLLLTRNVINTETLTPSRQTSSYLYGLTSINDWIELGFGIAFNRWEREFDIIRNEVIEITDFSPGFPFPLPVEPTPAVTAAGKLDSRLWSPKLGLQLTISPAIVLRAAAFKSFGNLLAGSQTIEPAQFMGFAQLYDEELGAETRNYALALDHSISTGWKQGLSYIRRQSDFSQLTIPRDSSAIDNKNFDDADSRETIANAYMSYLPAGSGTFSYTISANLNWNRRELRQVASDINVNLFSAPLRADIFLGEHFSVHLQQSYYRQTISRHADSTFKDEKDSWTTDVHGRYRLPDRWGDITLGIKNLTDETEEFVNYDASRLAFYPGRLWYLAVNINL